MPCCRHLSAANRIFTNMTFDPLWQLAKLSSFNSNKIATHDYYLCSLNITNIHRVKINLYFICMVCRLHISQDKHPFINNITNHLHAQCTFVASTYRVNDVLDQYISFWYLCVCVFVGMCITSHIKYSLCIKVYVQIAAVQIITQITWDNIVLVQRTRHK